MQSEFQIRLEARVAVGEGLYIYISCHYPFSLLDEYRELYELQRRRLEAQIHQLTQEKELWSNATYELALKVADKRGSACFC